jgi:hypothetical protein
MNRLLLLGTASVLALAINSASAQQQAASTAGAAAGSEFGEVIVTGTRRTDRTVAESSAPIDVLSGADLNAQPTGSMLDTLSNMVPSFIVGQNSISDASSFVRAPSLRGLPSDEMLVMLNGKRMNRSALVQVYQGGETELAFGSQGPDLASIPSIAVKNLEILRDGASAQYGSDAIAGVLNYQFKTNSSGAEIDARWGKYFPKGYTSDGDDAQVAFNIGLPLGSQGFANFSAELAKDNQTVRNPTRPSAVAFAADYPALAAGLPHWPGHATVEERQDAAQRRHQARRQFPDLLPRELGKDRHERELQLPPAEDRDVPGDDVHQPPGVQRHLPRFVRVPAHVHGLPVEWLDPGQQHVQLQFGLPVGLHAAVLRCNRAVLRRRRLQGRQSLGHEL